MYQFNFLTSCDYLIVILLLPGGVLSFLIGSKYSDLLTSFLKVEQKFNFLKDRNMFI